MHDRHDPIADNRLRYRPGEPGGHVESYFFKLNDVAGERALWLKLTVFQPAGRPEDAVGEVWAVSFRRDGRHVAVRQRYPLATLPHPEAGPGEIAIGPGRLGPGFTFGMAQTGSHRIEWNLAFTTEGRPLHLFPSELLLRTPLPRTKTVTPFPDERFDGGFAVDGEHVEVDGWRGCQGHNWGSEHAWLYGWVHCNLFDEGAAPDTVFEGLSARVGLGPGARLKTPPLSVMVLRHRGEELRFDSPVAMLGGGLSGGTEVVPGRYRFAARSGRHRLCGVAEAGPAQMVGLYYPNPDGTTTYCLNSKLARLELELASPGGTTRLVSAGRAALEIGTRDAGHGVRMYV